MVLFPAPDGAEKINSLPVLFTSFEASGWGVENWFDILLSWVFVLFGIDSMDYYWGELGYLKSVKNLLFYLL